MKQELTTYEKSLIAELLEQQIKKCGSELLKDYENILFKLGSGVDL